MNTPSRPSPSQAQAQRILSLIEGVPVRAGPRRAAPPRVIDDDGLDRTSQRVVHADEVRADTTTVPMVSEDDVLDAEELLPDPPGHAERAREFARAHAHVLMVLVVVALVFSAFRLMGASGHDVPAPTPTPSVVTPGPTPSSSPAPVITVHVLGAVSSPGVFRLESGARVIDVLETAGGLLPSGDVGELNLAAPVPDGAQLLVGTTDNPQGEIRLGTVAGASSTGQDSPTTTKVNLNTATTTQLETLPGVGPVMATRIIEWREQHGRFTDVQQLREIDGVGAKTFDRLAPFVEV